MADLRGMMLKERTGPKADRSRPLDTGENTGLPTRSRRMLIMGSWIDGLAPISSLPNPAFGDASGGPLARPENSAPLS